MLDLDQKIEEITDIVEDTISGLKEGELYPVPGGISEVYGHLVPYKLSIEEKKEGYTFFDYLMGALIIIAFIGGIATMLIAKALGKPLLILLAFGLIFTFVGIATSIKLPFPDKFFAMLFVIAGIACATISSFLIWGPENFGSFLEDNVLTLVVIAMSIIATILIGFGIYSKLIHNSSQYVPINAECIDIIYKKENRSKMFYPVFKYKIKSKEYIVKNSVGANSYPNLEVGMKTTIYVNINKPTTIVSQHGNTTMLVLGCFFLVFAIILFILSFNI